MVAGAGVESLWWAGDETDFVAAFWADLWCGEFELFVEG